MFIILELNDFYIQINLQRKHTLIHNKPFKILNPKCVLMKKENFVSLLTLSLFFFLSKFIMEGTLTIIG